jgi:hypothetical protein
VSCSPLGGKSPNSEVILFTAFNGGKYDISTIWSDGSHLAPFLTSQTDKSYVFASGNSLRSALVVLVNEKNAQGEFEDHLYLHRHSNGEWKRLPVGDGYEASGVISPDESRIVFMLAPKEPFGKLRLWTANLETGQVNRLTEADPKEAYEWDQYPAWSPDGQEIAFIRLKKSDKGLTSVLMRIPSTGGQPSVVLSGDEGVGGFCYAPDGKHLAVLTRKGLEIVELPELKRTVIATWDVFSNHQFRAGGLKWARTENKIALALFNKEKNQSEIWTVSPDGKDAKSIYVEEGAVLIISSFIQK